MSEVLKVNKRSLSACVLVAGSLLMSACGDSDKSEQKSQAKNEACDFKSELHVDGFKDKRSTSAKFCIKAVYPMGQTSVISDGDSGELGLIGLDILVNDKEYVCVVPVKLQDEGFVSSLQGENFSLRNNCVSMEQNPSVK